MTRFMNMIKEEGFFGKVTFYLYIKGHTKNDRDIALNRLLVMYRKQTLLLISDVKILIPEIMLKLFKFSMKTSLDWNHS